MDPDIDISPEDMLTVKAGVRARLVALLHGHRLAARTFRKAGKHQQAATENAEAADLLRMITSLDEPDELARLQEDHA